MYGDDGEKVKLNSEQRINTEDEIRKIFGNMDDLITTSMAPQFQVMRFIDSGSTERKKTIGRYFDLEIFDKKYKMAKEEALIIEAQIGGFDQNTLEADIEKLIVEGSILSSVLSSLNASKDILDQRVAAMNKKLFNTIYIENMKATLNRSKQNRDSTTSSISKKKMEMENKLACVEKLSKLGDQSINYEKILLGLESRLCDVRSKETKLSNIERQINQVNDELTEFPKSDCLANDNCFMKTKIDSLGAELVKLNESFVLIKSDLRQEATRIILAEIGDTRLNAAHQYDSKLKLKLEKSQIDILHNEISVLNDKLLALSREIEETENTVTNLSNKKYDNTWLDKENLESMLKNVALRIDKVNRKIGINQAKTEELEKTIKKIMLLKEYYSALQSYMFTMSKDGISYDIISSNLFLINEEINKLMSGVVNFTVTLEHNQNSKEIDIYFNHIANKKRLIEVCSGAEKTFAALAIRVALTNVTTLPRSNILILDEIFGALDSEYIEATYSLLQTLKNMFDCIIVITHHDVLKDVCDSVIEITRNSEGYSVAN